MIREGDIFLDLETLGLSPKDSAIYLIGLGRFNRGSYEIVQFFAENEQEEDEIIHAIFPYLTNASRIITFHGEAFDLPFLTKRSRQYHIPFSYEQGKVQYSGRDIESFDLRKAIYSLRRILQFPHYNQRTLEEFLQIKRKDDIAGKELITCYKAYMMDEDPLKRSMLLDHNRFDVEHMPKLFDLLQYRNIPDTNYTLTSFSSNQQALELCGTSDLSLPVPLSIHNLGVHLQFFDCGIKVYIPLSNGKMRYYLPNPKDYVRLKADGQLLPKALAASLPSSSYEKVDESNCYTEVSINSETLNPEYLSRYLKQLLRQI